MPEPWPRTVPDPADALGLASLPAHVIRAYRGAPFFATRAAAKGLCAEIDALPPGDPVTVDWSGIEATTGAFADEFVKWMLAKSRTVSIEGMNDEVLGTFALARQRREEPDA